MNSTPFLRYLIVGMFLLCCIFSSTAQTDIVDVAERLFHRNFRSPADTENIQPGKLLYAVVPGIGYSLQTSFDVVTTMNISFYSGQPKTTNLSAITFIPEYAIFNQQVILPLAYNIWTPNNKWDIMGDIRYYKYPSYTYGLGPNTTVNQQDLIDYSYIRVYQSFMRHITSKFYAGLGYNLDYHWNITPESDLTHFQAYNAGATQTTSSGIVLNTVYDERVNQNNPQGGFYANLAFRLNTTLLGSDKNWNSLFVEFRKYVKPFKGSNSILAFWSWNYFTFGGSAPYFDLPSTTWDTYSNLGRGYIQGRLRGPSLVYLESEFRFDILHNGLLGGVVFVNGQAVTNWPGNTMRWNNLLPGEGVGLRIKLNKYSKVNFCIDYGFGNEGSQGFFLNIAEVF